MLGRATPLGRSTPTLVRRDSHRVEDLAFDNLRLARRAAALQAQLERASLASSWGGWLGYGPEPTQLATVLDDELAAKAHENEQLHIAIYEQSKDLTKQQRTEAAQRWAALAALRGSLSELENDSEARAHEAAAVAKRHEDAIATLQQMCLELRLCCASQRDEIKALATEVAALRERHETHKQWRRRVRRYLRAAKADGSLLGDASNAGAPAAAAAAAPAAADEAADVDGGEGASADANGDAADGGAGEERRLRAALDREGELRRAAEAEAERLADVLQSEREAAQLAQERLGEQIGVLSDALAKKEEEEERRRQRRQQLQAQQAARAAAGGAGGSGGSGPAGVVRQASGAVGAAGAAATSLANGLTSVAAAPLSSSISMINGATAFCAKGIDSAASFAEKGLDSAATTVGLGTGGGAVK